MLDCVMHSMMNLVSGFPLRRAESTHANPVSESTHHHNDSRPHRNPFFAFNGLTPSTSQENINPAYIDDDDESPAEYHMGATNDNMQIPNNDLLTREPPPGSDALMDLDPHMYNFLVQDVTVLKTLLLRLRRVLQDEESELAEIPECSRCRNFEDTKRLSPDHCCGEYEGRLPAERSPTESDTENDLVVENIELKKQLAAMRQELRDRDTDIQQLQAKLTKTGSRTPEPSDTGVHQLRQQQQFTVVNNSTTKDNYANGDARY